MNKKGFVISGTLILLVLGIPALLLLVGGGLTAWKISQVTSSIPTWTWYLIAFVIILMLLPRKK